MSRVDDWRGGATPKRFRAGTHRIVAPSDTVERVWRLAPALGITRLANVTGLDVIGVPVVMACRPNGRSLSVSQGKGLDLDAARASGLMEATELHHAERITLPVKLATYAELCFTHRLADVRTLPLMAGSSFHPDRRILWIESFDLLAEEPVWLPHELVHTDFTVPLPTGSGCFAPGSNGLASGNHLLEAVVQGLCEVIERDAYAVWNAGGAAVQERRRVDPATVDDPACLGLLEKYRAAGVPVALWEITSDLGVAAFRCELAGAAPESGRHLPRAVGMGCHPNRGVALARALTEAAQSRLTQIAGSRDDMFRESFERTLDVDRSAAARADRAAGPAVRVFPDAPSLDFETFEEELAWLLDRLESAGFDRALVVDLTQEAYGIPVVRVVVPGLEPLPAGPGYAPGARVAAAESAGTEAP
jgi:ribosomal protein S12 methylthiotransferase accessory factor